MNLSDLSENIRAHTRLPGSRVVMLDAAECPTPLPWMNLLTRHPIFGEATECAGLPLLKIVHEHMLPTWWYRADPPGKDSWGCSKSYEWSSWPTDAPTPTSRRTTRISTKCPWTTDP